MGAPAYGAATPAGIMKLLSHYRIPLEGRTAAVVGRSPILGKPMAMMLLNANATVTDLSFQNPKPARYCARCRHRRWRRWKTGIHPGRLDRRQRRGHRCRLPPGACRRRGTLRGRSPMCGLYPCARRRGANDHRDTDRPDGGIRGEGCRRIRPRARERTPMTPCQSSRGRGYPSRCVGVNGRYPPARAFE